MSIKLVAFDLDGTFLNSKKQISPRNLEALKGCGKKGIFPVPATGRTIEGIPEEIKSLPEVRYAITLNGGKLMDMLDGTVLDERELENQTVLELLELVSKYHLMYDLYIQGHGIAEARFLDHLDEYKITPEIQALIRRTRTVVPGISEYVREYGKPVEKINLFFADSEEREKLRKLLLQRGDVIVSSSMSNNLEINGLGATKGEGLARLSAHLGLTLEETMACGDGENDITMIEAAGIGVAMENGEPKLKELADYITAGNDQDGVALAIEKFALS